MLSRPWMRVLTGNREKSYSAHASIHKNPSRIALRDIPRFVIFHATNTRTGGRLRKYQSVRFPGLRSENVNPLSFVHTHIYEVVENGRIFFVRAMQNFNCSHLSFVLGMSSPAVLPLLGGWFNISQMLSNSLSLSRSLSSRTHEWMGKCHPNSGHRPVSRFWPRLFSLKREGKTKKNYKGYNPWLTQISRWESGKRRRSYFHKKRVREKLSADFSLLLSLAVLSLKGAVLSWLNRPSKLPSPLCNGYTYSRNVNKDLYLEILWSRRRESDIFFERWQNCLWFPKIKLRLTFHG